MELFISLTYFWGGCDMEGGYRQRVRKRGIQTMVFLFSLLRLLV